MVQNIIVAVVILSLAALVLVRFFKKGPKCDCSSCPGGKDCCTEANKTRKG